MQTKEERRAYKLSWDRKHKDYYKSKNRQYYLSHRAGYRKRLDTFKKGPCADCKIEYSPWQMDFDHRKGQKKSFNIGSRRSAYWQTLVKEILKCDVVCSNCHRNRTHERTRALENQK